MNVSNPNRNYILPVNPAPINVAPINVAPINVAPKNVINGSSKFGMVGRVFNTSSGCSSCGR